MVSLKRKKTASARKPTACIFVVLLFSALVASHLVFINSPWSGLNEESPLLTQGLVSDVESDTSKASQLRQNRNSTSDAAVRHESSKQEHQDKATESVAQVKGVDTGENKKQDTVVIQASNQKDDGKFTVSSNFIRQLQSLDRIPRKVHIFFPDKEFANKPDPTPIVQQGILNLKRLNPNWNVTVYDDSDIDVIIRDATEILSQQERDILLGQPDGKGGWKNGAHVVEKTDLARLILMYTQGGLYMDVDRVVNVKLDDLFGPNARMCLPTLYDTNFMQDVMCSSAKNPVFLEAIKSQSQIRLMGGKDGGPLERRGGWAKTDDLFHMGPPTYNRIVSRIVFGKDNAIPKGDQILKARAAIEKTNGVIVTKREEWCDGLLVTPYEGCKAVNRGALYKQYNLTGWNDAVKARWEDAKK